MKTKRLVFLIGLAAVAVLARAALAADGRQLLVNRDFEAAAPGSLGGVQVSGTNANIDIQLADGVSSAFSKGNKSLKYTCRGSGGDNVNLTLWSAGTDAFSTIQQGNAALSLDIMFESIGGVSAKDPHNMPVAGPLGDGIRVDGAPYRFMYFIIGFANDNSMGIFYHTPVGQDWIDPTAVWKIEPGTWYRIEIELHGLEKGGEQTRGIPEAYSLKVSTPKRTLCEISRRTMPVSWIAYYNAREEKQQMIYDNLGIKTLFLNSSRFTPSGASYTFFLDNFMLRHEQ